MQASWEPRQLEQEGPIRLAYLSSDFCAHSVAHFILPLIACHDREAFEVTLYHSGRKSDEVTARAQRLADNWVSVASLDDGRPC